MLAAEYTMSVTLEQTTSKMSTVELSRSREKPESSFDTTVTKVSTQESLMFGKSMDFLQDPPQDPYT